MWVGVCGLGCVGVSTEIPVRSLIRQGQNKAKVYTGGRGGGEVGGGVGGGGGEEWGVGGGGEQARNSHTVHPVCGMLVCEGWRRIGVGHTRPFF